VAATAAAPDGTLRGVLVPWQTTCVTYFPRTCAGGPEEGGIELDPHLASLLGYLGVEVPTLIDKRSTGSSRDVRIRHTVSGNVIGFLQP
jgi:hypothetical protein